MRHAILVEHGKRFYIAHSKTGSPGIYRVIATMTSENSAMLVLDALQKENERKHADFQK